MRLYSLTGAEKLVDPEWGTFDIKDDGSFDLPDELAERELTFHHKGQPRWETEIDRNRRVGYEDEARRRDPAALFDAVAQLVALAQRTQASTGQDAPTEAKTPRGRGTRRAAAEDPAPEQASTPTE